MTAELVHLTRDQLLDRRRALLARIDIDESTLLRRAKDHALTPEERDALLEVEAVRFLLGEDE